MLSHQIPMQINAGNSCFSLIAAWYKRREALPLHPVRLRAVRLHLVSRSLGSSSGRHCRRRRCLVEIIVCMFRSKLLTSALPSTPPLRLYVELQTAITANAPKCYRLTQQSPLNSWRHDSINLSAILPSYPLCMADSGRRKRGNPLRVLF